MRRLANFLSGLFLVLVFVATVAFAQLNTVPVSVSLGGRTLPPLPVSAWIVGAFVAGGALGLLLGLRLLRRIRARAEIRRLRNRLSAAEQEVARLRSLSLKDLG